MGKNADRRRGHRRRQENTRVSPPPEQPEEGPRLCVRCRQCFALKNSDYCREHQPSWEKIRARIRGVFSIQRAINTFRSLAGRIPRRLPSWKTLVILPIKGVIGVTWVAALGVLILGGCLWWVSGRSGEIPPPLEETPTIVVELPSEPTPVPPTATPTEVPPTPVPREEDLIPDSILPYGFDREKGFTKGEGYLILRLFNGGSSLDGPCVEAGRQYLGGFFSREGFEVPIWDLELTPIVVPSDTTRVIQGVEFPVSTTQAYEVVGWIGDREVQGLLLELSTISGIALDQLACDQSECVQEGGRCLYIARAQTTRDRVYFWVEWDDQEATHSVAFAGRCGNFAAQVGELPAPEEVVPTPTPTPTGTLTPTPTEVPTNTPTPTPTGTLTPTPTEVPTNTPTPTPTGTLTPTPTEVPTNTPTPTPTGTLTPTPTEVPTETPTETPTEVPTATPTPCPECTPPSTPVPTPTAYPTNVPTPTPVFPTPTVPAPTATPTPCPECTPPSTPVPTPTAYPTNVPTPTPVF